ncbi:tRNA (adenine-N(1)-)-methyltransferase catalytic subunit trm61 [Nowakowskiella sp. JEL0407]|nr:tRNA (adenine-N(1)-)-methyltransferase catalytic subunit trm61 [Nowakowskiella sp. JEL0407]
MSPFTSFPDENIAKQGDLAIAYVSPESMNLFVLEKGKLFNNRIGTFSHDNFISKPWGSKIPSQGKKGYVYMLLPTPELWTLLLPHRTQILYLPDIAFISEFLELRPGSVVLESGTGSGSFSHSIARSIYPDGHLHTFEFHQPRAEQAEKEFVEHGLNEIVTIKCRDVCKDGFDLQDTVDAVFLDLPSPWLAIESAKKAFKKDCIGRICCFSPCMEQVLETVNALSSAGFSDIRMFETLVRPYIVQTTSVLPIPKVSKRKAFAKRGVSDTKEEESIDAPAEESTNSTEDVADNDNNVEEGQKPTENKTELISKVLSKVRGHTSYLTFATLLPEWEGNEREDALQRTREALLEDPIAFDDVKSDEEESEEEPVEDVEDGKRKKKWNSNGRGRGKRGRK